MQSNQMNITEIQTNKTVQAKKKKFTDLNISFEYENHNPEEEITNENQTHTLDYNESDDCLDINQNYLNTNLKSKHILTNKPNSINSNEIELLGDYLQFFKDHIYSFTYIYSHVKLYILKVHGQSNISHYELEDLEFAYACPSCNDKFEVISEFKSLENVDYKYFSMICKECSKFTYAFLKYFPEGREYILNIRDYITPKLISCKLTAFCKCGEKYVKDKFTATEGIKPRKCLKCREFISLTGCEFEAYQPNEQVISRCGYRFAKESDHDKFFAEYGFCTYDMSQYGYKLKWDERREYYKIFYSDPQYLFDKKKKMNYTSRKVIIAHKLN
jgi:hypothetical protein